MDILNRSCAPPAIPSEHRADASDEPGQTCADRGPRHGSRRIQEAEVIISNQGITGSRKMLVVRIEARLLRVRRPEVRV